MSKNTGRKRGSHAVMPRVPKSTAATHQGTLLDVPRLLELDENRRYTPRPFMHFIKGVAGVTEFDLDADADSESHKAPRWFSLLAEHGSAGQDSLTQSWLPEFLTLPYTAGLWRIFNNPPFSAIGARVEKIWSTIAEANAIEGLELRIAQVMPGNRVEQGWWQDHVEPFIAGHERARRDGYELVVHSPRTRQGYGHPGNPEGIGCSGTEWPSIVLVWRKVV